MDKILIIFSFWEIPFQNKNCNSTDIAIIRVTCIQTHIKYFLFKNKNIIQNLNEKKS